MMKKYTTIGERFGCATFKYVDDTGKYREWNRAYPKQNARVTLHVEQNLAIHKADAGWLAIRLEEYGESDAGNGRAKNIAVTLDQHAARKLYEMLKGVFDGE